MGHFFALLCPPPPFLETQTIRIKKKTEKKLNISSPQSHEVWFLRCRVRQTNFFVIPGHFVLLPTNKPENQNFEKMEKALHKCTKTEDHMMYG